MKTVRLEMPVAQVAIMISTKMKSDSKFAEYVVNMLSDGYKLDSVINVLTYGMPVQKIKTGTIVQCSESYWDNSDPDNGKSVPIGECVVVGFRELNAEYPYDVEYSIGGGKDALKRITSVAYNKITV